MLTVLGEALIDLVRDPDGRFTAHPGGSPLNVAVGLSRLGHRTQFMARLSTDAFGRQLYGHAEVNGVLLDAAPRVTEATTLAVVTLDEDGRAEYDFYVEGTADWQWTESELRAVPDGTTTLHTGSLASWTPPGAPRVAGLTAGLRAGGDVLLTYDPNVRPLLLPARAGARATIEANVGTAHVVKTSEEDLAHLYPGETRDAVTGRWLALGASLIVVTRGGDGVIASNPAARVDRPAVPIHLVDTIGAGDAFMAGLIGALTDRGHGTAAAIAGLGADDLADLVAEAALVAALACERAGADPPTRAEVEAARSRSVASA
ncbi:MAG: carbohydrate kinase [Actinomycetota bacterium]|nr:carbohydrate kinase [Actinomycetota bacterium]